MVEIITCTDFFKVRFNNRFVGSFDTKAEAEACRLAIAHLQVQVLPHLNTAAGNLKACEDNRAVWGGLCSAFFEMGGRVPRIGGERGKDKHAA